MMTIFAFALLCILGGTALYVLFTKVFYTIYQLIRDAKQLQ